MKNILTLLFLAAALFSGLSQSYENCPDIEWQRCMGQYHGYALTRVIQTRDGGYLAAGLYRDTTVFPESAGIYLIKVRPEGETSWVQYYGGAGRDWAYDVAQDAEGNYFVAGAVEAAGEDVSQSFGGLDAWLIKVGGQGELLWEKSFGGEDNDIAPQVWARPGGGIYLMTTSSDPLWEPYTDDEFDQIDFSVLSYTFYRLDGNGEPLATYTRDTRHARPYFLENGQPAMLVNGGPSGAPRIEVLDQNLEVVETLPLPSYPNPFVLWSDVFPLSGGGWMLVGIQARNSNLRAFEFNTAAQRVNAAGDAVWFNAYGTVDAYLYPYSARLLDDERILLGITSLEPFTGDWYSLRIGFLSPDGSLELSRRFGTPFINTLPIREYNYDAIATEDGGFMMAGITVKGDGEPAECSNPRPGWLVKLGPIEVNPLPEDTLLCPGEELLFSINELPNFSLEWQDGSMGNTYAVPGAGTYYYEGRQGQCIIRDTATVRLPEKEDLITTADTTLCQDATLLLDATVEGAGLYLWQDGAQGPTYEVARPGRYNVRAVVENCVLEDSLSVAWCEPCLAIPGAFTPNGDGTNDRFAPVVQCPFPAYSLQVFNRWGQLVFETTDPKAGWDGNFNGQPAPSEVYFYQMAYREFPGEAVERRQGDVTLLR